jgi:hypothetical protein
MRPWNLAGFAAGLVISFVPAAVLVLPPAAQHPAGLVSRRTQPALTSTDMAAAIHAMSGRTAACNAWPGSPGKFWCSDYGGNHCYYALFWIRGGRAWAKPSTESAIPCKSGQSGMHFAPGRGT